MVSSTVGAETGIVVAFGVFAVPNASSPFPIRLSRVWLTAVAPYLVRFTFLVTLFTRL